MLLFGGEAWKPLSLDESNRVNGLHLVGGCLVVQTVKMLHNTNQHSRFHRLMA